MELSPHITAGLLVVATLVASACSSPNAPGAATFGEPPEVRILLLSDEKRDGTWGPEAGFRGKLSLTEEGCVVGEGPDGEVLNLEFPAGTVISADDPNVVVLDFVELTIDESYAFGGSAGTATTDEHQALRELPPSCRQSAVFSIYTVA
ncbi:hypothetical protein V6S67_08145 [Arthrobacter sp. Soc17.1.1.1]|uniref:hypothetical protein n=1 Tax=Arthrobacter sp. Soc17.1.1.1 TaxID=3121277 RepID=UPI002FE4A1CD